MTEIDCTDSSTNCFFCGHISLTTPLMQVSNNSLLKYKTFVSTDFLETVLTALDVDGEAEIKNSISNEGFCELCMKKKLLVLYEVSLQIQQLMVKLKDVRVQCKEVLRNCVISQKDPSRNSARNQLVRVLEDRANVVRDDTSANVSDGWKGVKSISDGNDNERFEDVSQESFTSSHAVRDPVEGSSEELASVRQDEHQSTGHTYDIVTMDQALQLSESARQDYTNVESPSPIFPTTDNANALAFNESHKLTCGEVDELEQCTLLECSVSVSKIQRSSLISSQPDSHRNCPNHRCRKTFHSSDDLRDHLGKAHKKSAFTCPECSKNFRKKSKFTDHMNKHNNIRPYQCNVCPKTFYDRDNLADHRRKLHDRVSSVSCNVCHKVFKDSTAHEVHVRRYHSVEPFDCKHCSEKFLSYKDYKCHLKNHQDVSEDSHHVCDICGKAYTSSYYLLCHKKLHTGEQLFSCSQCDYKTPRKAHLQTHSRTHSTSERLQCEKCSKIYKNAAILKRHQLYDCGKEYTDALKCSFCGKCFKSRHILLAHEHNVHKVVGRPWLCPSCGVTFKIKKDLQSHIKRKHDENTKDNE